jgi:gamma-glutamyl-gamma-aminobutyraldehyde dehydrogenase/4-guanidinobutyraldehyde dehydrogenase/NAD-dependent aldehyde dehydrogenase
VGAVVPWNYPLIITAWKIAPALAAGNSVVLKPAELTSLSALKLAQLAAEAGVPAGVFNVVPGLGPVAGQALGRHRLVNKITFTGSPAVGRGFLTYAGESNGKQVALELGGKSAQVVLADAEDLDACAEAVAWGIFYNAGQTCHGGSRLIVDERVHDELVEKVLTVGRSLVLGDPLDEATQIGTIASEKQLHRVLEYTDIARAEGAVVHGGNRVRPDGLTNGYYVEPTVFDGVDNSSRIGQEEIFGPALAVTSVRGAAEAVRVANESEYGLAASVWTANITTAHAAARELRAGTVWINTYDASDIITPFGGFKNSGSGRDRSLHAFDAYTALKTTWINLGASQLSHD